MKKLIIALFSIILLVSCGKEKKQGNLELTGNIKGLNKGNLYLKKLKDSTLVTIDSIKIEGNSKFETAFTIDEAEVLYLFLDRGLTNSIDNSLAFFAEPGKMNIDTELATFYAKARITGSKNHELFEEYKKIRSRYASQSLDITKKRLEAFKNNTPLDPADEKNEKSILMRKYLYTVNFALNHKDHEVAPYLVLSEIPDVSLKYLDTIQKSMTPKIANSKYGKLLTTYALERRKAENDQK